MHHIQLENQKRPGLLQMHATPETESKLVKRSLYDALRAHGVKQEIVAKVLSVNQSSVSRMMNPVEDLHLSVAHLSLLHNDPYTAPVAEEILQALGGRFNTVSEEADGNLVDECLTLTDINGKLASIVVDGVDPSEFKKIIRLADKLEDIAMRLKAEVAEANKKSA